MSDDRELLELAAKAAGCSYIPGESWEEGAGWNPLDDDGDALRLAMALMMDVLTERGRTACHTDVGTVIIDHGDDPYAATRRAIVRAAAAIGRRMP